jgi:ABC-2 type transport system ATP-binding protein
MNIVMNGLSATAARERAEELLALVELEEAADRVIKGYSGGMQRRLDLAAALVHEPDGAARAG